MHCVTDYPVDYKYANLNAILTLKKELKLNIIQIILKEYWHP